MRLHPQPAYLMCVLAIAILVIALGGCGKKGAEAPPPAPGMGPPGMGGPGGPGMGPPGMAGPGGMGMGPPGMGGAGGPGMGPPGMGGPGGMPGGMMGGAMAAAPAPALPTVELTRPGELPERTQAMRTARHLVPPQR